MLPTSRCPTANLLARECVFGRKKSGVPAGLFASKLAPTYQPLYVAGQELVSTYKTFVCSLTTQSALHRVAPEMLLRFLIHISPAQAQIFKRLVA